MSRTRFAMLFISASVMLVGVTSLVASLVAHKWLGAALNFFAVCFFVWRTVLFNRHMRQWEHP